jgi:hypothetical protein
MTWGFSIYKEKVSQSCKERKKKKEAFSQREKQIDQAKIPNFE